MVSVRPGPDFHQKQKNPAEAGLFEGRLLEWISVRLSQPLMANYICSGFYFGSTMIARASM
jgi:hypothetical protein